MMMKDEEKRLHVSLESVVGFVDSIVVYDTGSTDNTIKIIKEFCLKHKIPLRLKEGEFVNFSVSRNVSLDFADTFADIDFLLLLDVNDELRGGDKLLKFAKDHADTEFNAFLMCQHWWSGNYDKYFNTRFIRARGNWRYNGSVHEWLADRSEKKGAPVFRMPDDIVLYQDRTQDGNKSFNRFTRDKELLLADYKKDPTEPRTLFYLAQTCSCLNESEEAFYYYKLRSELDGFQEEKFHAFLRTGECSEKLGHNWHDSLGYYMKAIEHSARAEPLIRIAQHYKNTKKWLISFNFAQWACSLPYPSNATLFVDKYSYEYTRWHILGIVAYYCQKYKEGKYACLKAIEKGLNTELDKSNLQFYLKKEQEEADKQSPLTKNEFISQTITELQKNGGKIPMKKMKKLALSKWKNIT
jgi:glycosyltransferase involved in cell wall biosynthesis